MTGWYVFTLGLYHMLYLYLFEFLGPVVEHLNYWGSKEGPRKHYRKRKLNSMNQLFLTLVQLRLNVKTEDLALRFGLSCSQISWYITT